MYDRKAILCCIYRQMDGYPSGQGADLADILKAEVGSVQALRHLVVGRCDEFPALLSKVNAEDLQRLTKTMQEVKITAD